MKVSAFIATTLDGYIAREDGDLDWLMKANEAVPEGEDCGYFAFMESVDVLIMGRHSFETVLSFDNWPYENMPVVVLSSQPITIPNDLTETVSHSSMPPDLLLANLSNIGVGHVYLDGGITIQRFLNAGLVDEMTITTVPILIGQGKSLFGDINNDVELTLVDIKAYEFGFIQSKYQIIKPSAE